MQLHGRSKNRKLRRGSFLVQGVFFGSAVGIGVAALAIDTGLAYTAKQELQSAADAAALAAASQLGESEDPLTLARLEAWEFAGMNEVDGIGVSLNLETDVVFGHTTLDPETGKFDFLPEQMPYDAVRVTLRRDATAEDGPVSLLFAKTLGVDGAELSASATAMLVPRDISIICDLSGSMNDDSELRHSKQTQINLNDIWQALGTPTYGVMTTWGDAIVLDEYDPTSDAGLLYLKRYEACTDATVSSNLSDRGYSAEEIDALMGTYYDNQSSSYKNRFRVILGLADWKSGKAGGKYGDGSGTGNGNNWIGNDELTDKMAFPYPSGASHSKWNSYMSYPQGSSSMKSADSRLRYRYGLKTFVNYLLEKRSNYSQTPVLWQTPEQPLTAVKDAVGEIVDYITEVDSGDHLSLEVYATTSRHEVDLTETLTDVLNTLEERQSNHYDNTTCVGCGIAEAHEELLSEHARSGAAKVMILLTDGIANTSPDGSDAKTYARYEAELASDSNITIYTVGVGSGADMNLMDEIAEIGHGTSFYATGSVEEYAAELREIFRTLGGKRPVRLIQ